MLGAFSPCSDTMLSEEKPPVADFSCSNLNSLKLGHNFPPFSFTQLKKEKYQKKKIYNLKPKRDKEHTESGRFEDWRGFEVGMEQTRRELRAMSSHLMMMMA